MRKQAQSTIVLLLFGFIIFVFVFSFGPGSKMEGCGRDDLAAAVNGDKVTISDFQYSYQQNLNRYLQQRRQTTSMTKEEHLMLRQETLQALIRQKLLLQAALNLGLRVSKEERNKAIRTHPYFQNEKTGKFEFERYKQIVQRQFRTTTAKFEKSYRDDMLVQKMASIIQDTASITDEELEHQYAINETKINLEYANLSPFMFRSGIVPSAGELADFEKSHPDRIEEYYKRHESRYHMPKKVQVAHIFFSVEEGYSPDQIKDKQERAELSLDDLTKGADFEKQAKEYSEDNLTKDKGGKLTAMTADTLAARWGTAFSEAALALNVSEQSQVVRSEKGFHLIKSLSISPAVDRKLEEVKQEIARELLIDQKSIATMKTKVEELMAGMKAGKSLAELLIHQDKEKPSFLSSKETGLIAQKNGTLSSVSIDKDFARAAFELSKDKPVPDQAYKQSGQFSGEAYIVYRLIDRVDPDMNKFAEAKEKLRNMQIGMRQQMQLRNWIRQKQSVAKIKINQALLASINNPLMSRPNR
jgi:peptidyl-prolyl cis-trans isomerase D